MLLAVGLVISGYVHWLNECVLIVFITNDIGIVDEKGCCDVYFIAVGVRREDSFCTDWILSWGFAIG